MGKTATLKISLITGQKYWGVLQGEHSAILSTCNMLQGEHSAIFSTFIKLPFVIKIFVLFIFEWPFYTGFTASRLGFYAIGK